MYKTAPVPMNVNSATWAAKTFGLFMITGMMAFGVWAWFAAPYVHFWPSIQKQ